MPKYFYTIVGGIFLLIIVGAGTFLYVTRPITASHTAVDVGQPVGGENDGDEGVAAAQDKTSSEDGGMDALQKAAADVSIPVGSTRFTVLPESSEASFTINEVLRGSPFTVVGTTKDLEGSIFIDMAHPEKSSIGMIRINAQTLHTDDPRRDGAIGRLILHAEDSGNEYIVFTPTKISGLPTSALSKKPISLTIVGNLTISGITHQASFSATDVALNDDVIKGVAQTTIKRSDYNLVIPNIPFVAEVPDMFTIKINLTATQVAR